MVAARKVILAQPRGFCAGVIRAIDIVEQALAKFGAPVYVRHEIVHNRHVVERLRERGARFVEHLSEVPAGAITIFSAHGVARRVEDEARARGLRVLDATCPLVAKVHGQGKRYVAKGRVVILVGHAGHPEVEGTMGQIEGPAVLVQTESDVEALDLAPDTPVAYITQTTLSVDDTRAVIAALKRRFRDIVGPDVNDICYATQNRQSAVRALAKVADVILVVGAKNSSNSNRLREIGADAGVPSYLIADGSELDPAWVRRRRGGRHHRGGIRARRAGRQRDRDAAALQPGRGLGTSRHRGEGRISSPCQSAARAADGSGHSLIAAAAPNSAIVAIPLLQKARVGAYIVRQQLAGRQRYPLVLMLEPLFRCNLACAGCGKIDYPDEILKQRLSVNECLAAVDECGAPVVSIAGGEPLLHKEIEAIVEGIVARRKFVYLCTNALLMQKRLALFRPSPYFVWSVHLDGDREMHDRSVCEEGVYDRAVAAIRAAKERGFRVNINCTLFNDADPERVARFFDSASGLGIDGITVSPGYAYERAPDQAHFLTRDAHQAALSRHLSPRPRRARVVVQSIGPVSRLPRRQPRVPVYSVGQPDAQRFRMAASLLSSGRRLCAQLSRTDGRNRLGRIRHRQLREVCRLHGAQRLRSDGRAGRGAPSAPRALRRMARGAHRGRHGAGDTAHAPEAGAVRLLKTRRAEARRDPDSARP